MCNKVPRNNYGMGGARFTTGLRCWDSQKDYTNYEFVILVQNAGTYIVRVICPRKLVKFA